MLCIRYRSRDVHGCLADARIVDMSTNDDLVIAAIKITSLEQARQVVSCLQAGLEGADIILDGAASQDTATGLRGVTMWMNALFGRLEDL